MGDCYHNGRPKRRWTTRAQAKAAMRTHQAQGIDDNGAQPYRCDHCGYFHLGHYPTDPEARAAKQARHRPTG